MLLAARREEKLQFGESPHHTCFACVFDDLQVLTARMMSFLGKNLKGNEKPTMVGEAGPDFK